jgi:hypothetical protein
MSDTGEVAVRRDFMMDNARRLLVIGVFLMPMLTFRLFGQTTATTESGLTVSDFFFFLAVILLAASAHRRRLPPTQIWYVGVAFVVGGGLLATFKADSPAESVFVVFRMVFVLLVWQWTIRHLVGSDKMMRTMLLAFVFGCVASSLVAVVQLEGHALVSLGTVFNGRASGLAKHPDDTGSFLALGITFAVALAFNPAVRRRWVPVVSALVIAMGLIVSGSVSGMLCGLAGCVVVFIVRGVKLRNIFAIVLLLAVAYVGATALQGASGHHSLNPIARFEAATGSESGGANSVTPREGTWKGAWWGIENSPIVGHGLDIESSLTYLDPNNNTYYPTHNFILMGWFQGGMFFLLGELICIGEGIRRMFMNGRPDPTRTALVGGAVAVIAVASQAPMMFDRYFWFPFVLATAYPMLARNGTGTRTVELDGAQPSVADDAPALSA